MNNRKIKDLRAFLTETLQKYEYEKFNLSDNEFGNSLKMTCYFIEKKMESTIEYYQRNKASIIEFNKAKDKYKDLSILLNKYNIELTKLGINQNERLNFKKEVDDAFDFELIENTKEPLLNYLEIEKEFLDCIKIEILESEMEKNPFPTIFTGTNNKTFTLFETFTKQHLLDKYIDFSFIFQQMKFNGYISDIKHLKFMDWLNENKYITEKEYSDFKIEKSFRSLKKCAFGTRVDLYLKLQEILFNPVPIYRNNLP